MQSIETEITHTILIQKSKFICRLTPVQNIETIKKKLQEIKTEFPNATHYCYAYLCGSEKRCCDDGEPNGTAGMPILNVLEKKELDYILCIVVRYFGGIKLGASGLVRAYSNSVTETLSKTSIVEMIPGIKIICQFPYSNEKKMEYLLQNAKTINKEYREKIIYTCLIDKLLFNRLKSSLEALSLLDIKEDVWMKK